MISMRPLLHYASRSIFADAALLSLPRSKQPLIRSTAKATSSPPSICIQCRFQASSAFAERRENSSQTSGLKTARDERRTFSSSSKLLEKTTESSEHTPETKPPPPQSNEPPPPEPSPIESTPQNKTEDTIARVPAEDLPSHREQQRWDLSKRFSELMDDLLPKLAVMTHKVNTYTGTDYSSIEALRREIKEQEQLVKARRQAVDEAKQAVDVAHAQQASAQKEVVGLLERKHSWSAADLERYMSLIRSEHINDRAVREAKEKVFSAETALEEARTQLEKRERAQYHEEQIWSDTIRRNSTWVTFGLMGVNIFLLLASLVVLEPWRRRRMVREIKAALEAQRPAMEAAAAAPAVASATVHTPTAADIDEVVEPVGQSLESLMSAQQPVPWDPEIEKPAPTEADAPAPKTSTVDVSETAEEPQPTISVQQSGAGLAVVAEEPESAPIKPTNWREQVTEAVQDLLSERYVSLRKVDLTAAVLESATAGAVLSGLLFLLLRPN